MNDYYAQGFVDKCAAHGIDPEQLMKYAQVDVTEAPARAAATSGELQHRKRTKAPVNVQQALRVEGATTGPARRNLLQDYLNKQQMKAPAGIGGALKNWILGNKPKSI
jgi:hypothetical protein